MIRQIIILYDEWERGCLAPKFQTAKYLTTHLILSLATGKQYVSFQSKKSVNIDIIIGLYILYIQTFDDILLYTFSDDGGRTTSEFIFILSSQVVVILIISKSYTWFSNAFNTEGVGWRRLCFYGWWLLLKQWYNLQTATFWKY